MWRTHDVKQLATPQAFDENPGLVWSFYLERRCAAREAEPNAAHEALAEFGNKKNRFLAMTMNCDGWSLRRRKQTGVAPLMEPGLSERAGHPPEKLEHLHGNLFDLKCSRCVLRIQSEAADRVVSPVLVNLQRTAKEAHELADLGLDDAPHCPNCTTAYLRPDIVWFSEPLPSAALSKIYNWIESTSTIDTMLMIGTSAEVYPATVYVEGAKRKGARVAVVNAEQEDVGLLGRQEQDWYLQGDAAIVVPQMLEPTIGIV